MSSKISIGNAMTEKNYDRNCDYPPRERAWYKPDKDELISTAPDGAQIKLPNPLRDDIVSNNIVCPEFDYTESPYLDEEMDLNPRH